MANIRIIGLTGGIGSGKSTVAAMLASLGAKVINADFIGHEVLAEDPGIKAQLVNHFGSSILNPDSTINREALAKAAFASHDDIEFLNRLMHPEIHSRILSLIKLQKEAGTKFLVIEAPLLIEAGWAGLADTVWVTEAPLETRLARLVARGMSQSQVLERINAQMSDEKRGAFAHIIIDTNIDLARLQAQITELFINFKVQNC